MASWRRRWLLSVGAAGALAVSGGASLADQVDGDWCFPADGRNLHIEGDDIVTPNGTSTTGDYTRQSFRYVMPDSDPGAGDEIKTRQLNEQSIVLLRPDRAEETWTRCDL